MFFEFDEPNKQNDKKVIEFEVSDKRYDDFKLALSVLNVSKEQAFEDFLSVLITKALKKAQGIEDEPVEKMVEDDKRLSPRVIESRIKKWAKNRSSYPHLILKAFLNAYLMIIEYNEKGVYRAKMEAHFNNLTNSEPSNNSRFISVFRQMCSASSRAYGDIFIYDRAHESVFLNNQYKDLILSLKDSFLE